MEGFVAEYFFLTHGFLPWLIFFFFSLRGLVLFDMLNLLLFLKHLSSNNSYVGGLSVFTYNAQYHNVIHVTHADYQACNETTPIATYTTGNDSYIIKTHGHHYFLCGVPGHCLAGQKVDINVAREAVLLAPTPQAAPSSGESTSSLTPAISAPAASPSDSPPLNALVGLLSKLGFAMAVFVVFVSTYA